MHYEQSENPCRNIVEDDSGTLGKSLQLTNRGWLDDVEGSKKYKTRKESFPSEGDGDERD